MADTKEGMHDRSRTIDRRTIYQEGSVNDASKKVTKTCSFPKKDTATNDLRSAFSLTNPPAAALPLSPPRKPAQTTAMRYRPALLYPPLP